MEATRTLDTRTIARVLAALLAVMALVFAVAAIAPDGAQAAKKGWHLKGSKLYYVKADGKKAKSTKVDGITLKSNGYAKNNTASQLKKLCMKRIKKWTSSSQSRYQKLKTCFSYCVSMPFVLSMAPKDLGTSGWVQRCALRTLKYNKGECFGCACSFAMLAYELGYKPTVYGYPEVHSYVIINGKRWDNMASQPKIAGVEHWKVVNYSKLSPKGTKSSVFKWGEKYDPGTKRGLYKKKGAYFYAVDGKNLKKAWKTVKGKTYYFKSNGKAATGSYKVKRTKSSKKAYWVFSAKGVLMKGSGTRVVKVDGVKYQVKKSGKAKSGWDDKHAKYYLKNGAIATYPRLMNGKLTYFSAKGSYSKKKTKKMRAALAMGKPATTLLKLLGDPKKVKTYDNSCYMLPGNPDLGGVDRVRTYQNVSISTFVADDGVEYLESIAAC